MSMPNLKLLLICSKIPMNMEYENQDNDKDFIGHSIQKSEISFVEK